MPTWYRANRPLRIGPGIERGQVFPARAGAKYRALRAMGAVSLVSDEDAAKLGADPDFWEKIFPPKAVKEQEPGEILFTSDSAQAAAEKADLYPEDFDGHAPSGAGGTRYTVADVEAVAAAKAAKAAEKEEETETDPPKEEETETDPPKEPTD